MQFFLRFVAVYFIIGLLVIAIFRDNPMHVIQAMGSVLGNSVAFFLERAWGVLVLFAAMFLFLPWRVLVGRLPRAFVALIAANAFFLVFTMVKSTLPNIIPFYSDPFWAALDRVIHFGIDPWKITHALGAKFPVNLAEFIYMDMWLIPAMFLPVILVLFDDDQARVSRYLKLYLLAWAGIGTVLALAGMSAGPIYYDRIEMSDRFAGLLMALKSAGISDSPIGATHEYLWSIYASKGQALGSGISAFPSVHVAMVGVYALYMVDRTKWLWPVSVALVLIYLFLSVHLGWHYAIDGYVSLLVVFLGWKYLNRHKTTSDRRGLDV